MRVQFIYKQEERGKMTKQIYLVKAGENIRVFYGEAEMRAAGFTAADKVVTEAEFNGNGCYARIINGEIVVGFTEAEKTAREQAEQIAEIKAMLAEIDRLDGPRPIREAVRQMADATGLDTSRIMRHEDKAQALRAQLAAITAQ
jgi:hypothetical protein